MARKRTDFSKAEPSNGMAEGDTTSSQESAQHGPAFERLQPSAAATAALDAIKRMEFASDRLRLDSSMSAALEASKSMEFAKHGLMLESLKLSAAAEAALEAIKRSESASDKLRLDSPMSAALEASKGMGLAKYGLMLDSFKPSAAATAALEEIKRTEFASDKLQLDSPMSAALEASKSMGFAKHGLMLESLKLSAAAEAALEAIKRTELASEKLRHYSNMATVLEASKGTGLAQYGLVLDALKPSAGVASAIDAIKSMGLARHGLALEGFAQVPGLPAVRELSRGMSGPRYGLPSEIFNADELSSFASIADLAEPVKRQIERSAAYEKWKNSYDESIRDDKLAMDFELNAEAAIANFFNFIFSKPNVSDLFKTLSEASWFVSLDLRSRLSKISSLLGKHGQSTDITSYVGMAFESVYEESISDLSLVLIKRHPSREKFIRSAVTAHKNGNYELSVPVFLIQADGVAHDVNHELFSNVTNKKRNGCRPNVNKLGEFESGKSIVDKILWSPLSSELPVLLPGNKWKGGLNRNMVLHGHDCGYATKENSLKAFSLLSYVSSLLSRVTH